MFEIDKYTYSGTRLKDSNNLTHFISLQNFILNLLIVKCAHFHWKSFVRPINLVTVKAHFPLNRKIT